MNEASPVPAQPSPAEVADHIGLDPNLPLPRTLVFFATLWLIGSWLLTIGLHRPVQPSSAAYEPSVRLMLVSLASGLLIGWPLFRLSQRPTAHAVLKVVVDLFVLIAMMQVVIWPLRLVTRWTIARTCALDLALVGWVVLAGAIVASAIGTVRHGPRLIAMALLLAICAAGPVIELVIPNTNASNGQSALSDIMQLSPFVLLRDIAAGGGAPMTTADLQPIMLLGLAVAVAWLTLLFAQAFSPVRRRGGPQG